MGGTQRVTAAGINALAGGDKLKVGAGLYIRMNGNGTVTVWGRIKVQGRSVDVKLGAADAPVTKHQLDDLLADAAKGRRAAVHARPVAKVITSAALTANATVGDVWHDLLAGIDANGKWTPRNRKANIDRAKRYLLGSDLFKMKPSAVTPMDVVALLQPMGSTPDQQTKVRGLLTLTFARALGAQLCTSNPARDALAVMRTDSKARKRKHYPTLLDVSALASIVDVIINSKLSSPVRRALLLQAFTCQRSGEVVGARWEEFSIDAEGDNSTWTIPRARMKSDHVDTPHVVPLSKQAVKLLISMRGDAAAAGFLFSGRSEKDHLNTNTLPRAMANIGLKGRFVPHSWRSAFRTLGERQQTAEGNPQFSPAWLEYALDHASSEELGSAYQRGGHIDGARRALAWWGNQLTGVGK